MSERLLAMTEFECATTSTSYCADGFRRRANGRMARRMNILSGGRPVRRRKATPSECASQLLAPQILLNHWSRIRVLLDAKTDSYSLPEGGSEISLLVLWRVLRYQFVAVLLIALLAGFTAGWIAIEKVKTDSPVSGSARGAEPQTSQFAEQHAPDGAMRGVLADSPSCRLPTVCQTSVAFDISTLAGRAGK
jgi:hypothetical protein